MCLIDLYIAIIMNSSLRPSGMSRVNEGSHSFTSNPHMHVYPQVEWTIPAFSPSHRASTHFGRYSFSVPLRVTELAWVAGYMWFTSQQTVTHLSTNRARRRVTSLIETNALKPSRQAAKPYIHLFSQGADKQTNIHYTNKWTKYTKYTTQSTQNKSVMPSRRQTELIGIQ